MRFRQYHQPDGHYAGAPNVLATPHTAEYYSLEKVKYDRLEELLYHDYELTPRDIGSIVLYTSTRNGIANASPGTTDPRSFMPVGSRTLYVNAALAHESEDPSVLHRRLGLTDRAAYEPHKQRGFGVMEEVIYRAALAERRKQSSMRKLGRRLPVAAAVGAPVLEAALTGDATMAAAAVGGELVMGFIGGSIYLSVRGNSEKNGADLELKKMALLKSFENHKHDVMFKPQAA